MDKELKVLFVSRQFKPGYASPIVEEQLKSLIDFGLIVEKFLIEGEGYFAYVRSIFRLKQRIRSFQPDLIHAHYSFSGITTYLAFRGPIVCSLMGSDVFAKSWYRNVLHVFSKKLWKSTIVKAQNMKETINLQNAEVVPNGINMIKFSPKDKDWALKSLGWNEKAFHVLFPADPKRAVKNFQLAKKAFDLVPIENKLLHTLDNVKHDDMPALFNASNVILLTSKYEGSPNVIKEAASCNRPIVSTNVGDVVEVIGSADGCFIVENYLAESIADKVFECFNYKQSNARDYIAHLEQGIIAKRLYAIYTDINR